jgi:hypothetical protein
VIWRRLLRTSALFAAGALLGALLVATLLVIVAAAGGVLTTPPGAWVLRVSPLPGVGVKLSVPGLARFATSPLALWLLDGLSFATRFGRLRFGRDGDALTVACAPCRVDDPRLATQPLIVERAQVTVARVGTRTLRGSASAGAVVIDFTASLEPDRIDIDWTLPPASIGDAYRVFAGVIAEASLARIGGRISAHGSLRLPQRRARTELAIDGFTVAGLGTERLAAGPVPFACRDARGVSMPRRVIPGEGRWISPAQSGALLAAAVLAAEDQRFLEHDGFDRVEMARVLASVEEQGVGRGASTITQQLARGLVTGGERTAARKLRELLYAVEMERTLGKQLILALYLNTVDWGPGLCGADAAARTYFGKRPGELTPLEAAWLASILPNPAQAYENEFLAGAADPARAGRVLRQMRGLPRVERERWAASELVFAAPPAGPRGPSPFFAVVEDGIAVASSQRTNGQSKREPRRRFSGRAQHRRAPSCRARYRYSPIR